MVLFIVLYKVALIFESVDELLCDYSTESYLAELSEGAVCFSMFCKILLVSILDSFWCEGKVGPLTDYEL